MATSAVRGALFLSSYAPATLILAIRYAGSDVCRALLLVALTVALLVVAAAAYTILSTGSEDDLRVLYAEQQREAFTSYLLGYLLPVILVDLSDTSAVTAVVVFLLFLGLVFIRSNLTYLNPLLALAGFRLFSITGTLATTPNGLTSLLVLTRDANVVRGNRVALRGADHVFRFARVKA